MAKLGFIHTAGALATLPRGRSRGRVSRGKNYMWDDRAYRAYVYQQARNMLKATAKQCAKTAKEGMQDIPGPANPGEYPAIQSGNLQNAIDYEIMEETRYYIKARFGVYGNVAKRTQADFNPDYDDNVPVGEYAYTLETGVGRKENHRWPWVTKTLEDVDGWVDAETPAPKLRSEVNI